MLTKGYKTKTTLLPFLLPAAIVLILASIVPLIMALVTSFYKAEGTQSVFVGLTNYKEVIKTVSSGLLLEIVLFLPF